MTFRQMLPCNYGFCGSAAWYYIDQSGAPQNAGLFNVAQNAHWQSQALNQGTIHNDATMQAQANKSLYTCSRCESTLLGTAAGNAKWLPCMHILCYSCFDLRPTERQNNAVMRRCPSCSYMFADSRVMDCSLLLESPVELKCKSCPPMVQPGPVQAYCEQCNESLCMECAIAHKRVSQTKDHQLKEMCSTSTGQYCLVHPNELLPYWCQSCSVRVCRLCFQSHTPPHSVVRHEEALDKQKVALSQMQENHKRRIVAETGIINVAQQRKGELDVHTQEARAVVAQAVTELSKEVCKRGKELIDSIDAASKEKKRRYDIIEMEHKRVMGTLVLAQHAANEAHNRNNPQTIHLTRKRLLSAEQLTTSHNFNNLQTPSQLNADVSSLEHLKRQIAAFGVVQVDRKPFSVNPQSTRPQPQQASASAASVPRMPAPPQTSQYNTGLQRPTNLVRSTRPQGPSTSQATTLQQMIQAPRAPAQPTMRAPPPSSIRPQATMAIQQVARAAAPPQHSMANQQQQMQAQQLRMAQQQMAYSQGQMRMAQQAVPSYSQAVPQQASVINSASRIITPPTYPYMAPSAPQSSMQMRQQGCPPTYVSTHNAMPPQHQMPPLYPRPPVQAARPPAAPSILASPTYPTNQSRLPFEVTLVDKQQTHSAPQQSSGQTAAPQPQRMETQIQSVTSAQQPYTSPPTAVAKKTITRSKNIDDIAKGLAGATTSSNPQPESLPQGQEPSLPTNQEQPPAQGKEQAALINQGVPSSSTDPVRLVLTRRVDGTYGSIGGTPPVTPTEPGKRMTPGADEVTTTNDPNENFCAICHDGVDEESGELGCCYSCPKVYHGRCHVPAVMQSWEQMPDDWKCTMCQEVEPLTEKVRKRKQSGDKEDLTPEERKLCEKVLLKVMCHTNSIPFHTPVNKDEYPDYYRVVTHPMDMRKVKGNLRHHVHSKYRNVPQFMKAMNKIFKNCSLFNPPFTDVALAGQEMLGLFGNAVQLYLPAYSDLVWSYQCRYTAIQEEEEVEEGEIVEPSAGPEPEEVPCKRSRQGTPTSEFDVNRPN